MSRNISSKKRQYRIDRQREYVGNIVMCDRELFNQMVMSGWPVRCSKSDAMDGTQRWKDEKQAFLAAEKVSLAEAMNALGSDFILDLTSAIVSKASEDSDKEEVPVVKIPALQDKVITVDLAVKDENLQCQVVTERFDIVRNAGRRPTFVEAVPLHGYDVAEGLPLVDEKTETVVTEDGIVGSFVARTPAIELPIRDFCTSICAIPIEVLNVMVREDPVMAEKCRLVVDLLECGHLDGIQLPSERISRSSEMFTGSYALLGRHSGRGLATPLLTRFRPAKKRLSDHSRQFLKSLQIPGVASRALCNGLRYTAAVGKKCTILIRERNFEPPRYTVTPVRVALPSGE